jgi:uncharacterized protein (DUF2141 family)
MCNLAVVAAGIFLSGTALAHHDSDTLELYPRDASDPCVENSLQIRVNVIGVTHMGIMKLELYNSNKGFLKKKGRLRPIRVAAEDGPQKICINVPKPGRYAVAGYHDLDANRKVKKSWDFTPKEPYGLSNNPEFKKKRRPKFEEAAFDVGPQGADIDFILVDLQAKTKQ